MQGNKQTEVFSLNGRSDKKHKLNTSMKNVSQDVLDRIEQGVTLEELISLTNKGYDVFKYQTQITIHGLFPKLSTNELGGYHTLIQNKNKSIGVKWNGVDYDKKKRIYKLLSICGFKSHKTSTSWEGYKMHRITKDNQDEIKALYETYKLECENVNKVDFYGRVAVYYADLGWYSKFLVYDIVVNGILEKNIDSLIQAITNKSVSQLEIEYTTKLDKDAKERAERNAQYEIERAEREAKCDKAIQNFIDNGNIPQGVEKMESVDIKNGLVEYIINYNHKTETCELMKKEYKKTACQKKFRVYINDSSFGDETRKTKLTNTYILTASL